MVAESICIYKYIDPEYKNRVVSIKIKHKLEKIEEVEKNKNIDIEDYSEKELETERKKYFHVLKHQICFGDFQNQFLLHSF
jgi:hypothetical protein